MPVGTDTVLNVAVIVVLAEMVVLHVPVPEQPPPDHPANVEPDAGVAVRVVAVPVVIPETEHVVPQFIEPPDDVIVPVPVPDLVMVREKVEGVGAEPVYSYAPMSQTPTEPRTTPSISML